MAQQTLLGGDGVTGENGATHNTKANANFTELYANVGTAQSTADTANSNLSTHISDSSAAHAGSAISFAPGGGLSSTDVQSAIIEAASIGGVADASVTVKGIIELATQGEVNTGTDGVRAVTPELLKNRDGDVTALTDSSTTAISSDKWTWATSSSTRTATFTFTGDFSFGKITLSAAASTITFPAAALCIVDGTSSGDNIAVLSGVSGDKYDVGIVKVGSAYSVYIKNIGQ